MTDNVGPASRQPPAGAELVELPDGRQAWYYGEGPVELRDVASGQIVKARSSWTSPEQPRQLARQRWDAVDAARWDGLAAAAVALAAAGLAGLPADDLPAAAIAAVVKRLAMSAVKNDDRNGNEAARLILQVAGILASREGASPQPPANGASLQIGEGLAARLLDAIAASRRQPAPPAQPALPAGASAQPQPAPDTADSQPQPQPQTDENP